MAINRIRAFNRFYTHKIGLITNRFLGSEYSLVQARVLFELNHDKSLHASDLGRKLGLSPDHLSKVISRFLAMGLVHRKPSPGDGRKQLISLTAEGRAAYANLRKESNTRIKEMLRGLKPEELQRLTGAMNTIEQVLSSEKRGLNLVILRPHRPGDIGYVIHRHGVLYAREHGFNHEFDAYVALNMAKFIQTLSDREHLWIAEAEGKFVGSAAIVRLDDFTAQLRWLIVEPEYRKKGIGKQLVADAVHFSREKGYRSVILWTIDFLKIARGLYGASGFSQKETKVSHAWGKCFIEECWKLHLD